MGLELFKPLFGSCCEALNWIGIRWIDEQFHVETLPVAAWCNFLRVLIVHEGCGGECRLFVWVPRCGGVSGVGFGGVFWCFLGVLVGFCLLRFCCVVWFWCIGMIRAT